MLLPVSPIMGPDLQQTLYLTLNADL